MDHRLAVAWGLCQPDISWNGCVKNQAAIETLEVCRDRGGEPGAFVIHRQEEAFDLKLRVNHSPQAGKCIEQFRNTFKRVVLALNRHKQRVGGCQSVNGKKV